MGGVGRTLGCGVESLAWIFRPLACILGKEAGGEDPRLCWGGIFGMTFLPFTWVFGIEAGEDVGLCWGGIFGIPGAGAVLPQAAPQDRVGPSCVFGVQLAARNGWVGKLCMTDSDLVRGHAIALRGSATPPIMTLHSPQPKDGTALHPILHYAVPHRG
eukprot:1160179-Pelagomonas_calceolata.AAC.16